MFSKTSENHNFIEKIKNKQKNAKLWIMSDPSDWRRMKEFKIKHFFSNCGKNKNLKNLNI